MDRRLHPDDSWKSNHIREHLRRERHQRKRQCNRLSMRRRTQEVIAVPAPETDFPALAFPGPAASGKGKNYSTNFLRTLANVAFVSNSLPHAYLFLDGVSLRVRPMGCKPVQMLVANGIPQDGRRHLRAFFCARQGESQADWEGLLQDLYRRGLERPSAGPDSHRRLCRLGGGGKPPFVPSAPAGVGPSRLWPGGCSRICPSCCRSLLSPAPVAQTRTTNVIERWFVEVRRRSRPAGCLVTVQSVDRII